MADSLFVSLYLIGDQLHPEDITSILGKSPSFTYRKGDSKKLRSGKIIIRETGIWQLRSPIESIEIRDHVDWIALQCRGANKLLSKLPGVEDAHIDIYCAQLYGRDDYRYFNLEISLETLGILTALGMGIRLRVDE